MARTTSRPLSPHLTIWKWGPHMAVSIMHRVTGNGLATVGALGLVWWLMAAATLHYANRLTAMKLARLDLPEGNAMRAPGERIHWDGPGLRVTNNPSLNDHLHIDYRPGWSLG